MKCILQRHLSPPTSTSSLVPSYVNSDYEVSKNKFYSQSWGGAGEQASELVGHEFRSGPSTAWLCVPHEVLHLSASASLSTRQLDYLKGTYEDSVKSGRTTGSRNAQ